MDLCSCCVCGCLGSHYAFAQRMERGHVSTVDMCTCCVRECFCEVMRLKSFGWLGTVCSLFLPRKGVELSSTHRAASTGEQTANLNLPILERVC